MGKLISIIIPTLNEEKCIGNLLRDLAAQTEQCFEVIVVDGQSTDNTLQKIEAFNKSLSLKIISSPKCNLSYQRNLGAKSATGNYVLFLDADVHVRSSFMRRLVANIHRYKYLIYLPLHLPNSASQQDRLMYQVLSFFVELSHLTEKPFSYGPGAIFQREFFYHIGGYDEKAFVYEDHEIIQRAHGCGVKAKLLQKVPLYFSMRRYKKEGRFVLLQKYLTASLYLLAKGKVDKEIFSYDMGGKANYLLAREKHIGLSERVTHYFDKLKTVLEEN